MTFRLSQQKNVLLMAIIFLSIGLVWPLITESSTFDIIVKIRQSIHSGDSGNLIIAAMISCILFTIPSTFFYISLEYLGCNLRKHLDITVFGYSFLLVLSFAALKWFAYQFLGHPYEPVSSFVGLLITLLLVQFSKHDQNTMFPKILIAFQVFFYVQWFNVMPLFSLFKFGTSDIPVSIKIASDYLDNISIVNSIGFSFVMPLMLSSVMTSMNFRLYIENLKILQENYDRAIALETMQNKIMDNRVYQEINALAHDLKTPLATIRGLTSLLTLNKDVGKLEVYGSRIDQAIVKMSDMISSFLYGTSRESLAVSALVDYIRAQIPIEDEHLHFSISLAPNLPSIMVNKIRIARALVNLVENAILAPPSKFNKEIHLGVYSEEQNVIIKITDNGMGIPDEELRKIWLIGYSTKNTTGLGLPFAKQTIDEHNGTISISSHYGKGTIVTVSLPAEVKEVQSHVE